MYLTCFTLHSTLLHSYLITFSSINPSLSHPVYTIKPRPFSSVNRLLKVVSLDSLLNPPLTFHPINYQVKPTNSFVLH